MSAPKSGDEGLVAASQFPHPLPHASKTTVYVAEDPMAAPATISKRSPRMVQACRETGVPYGELVVLDRRSFSTPGLMPEVALARYSATDKRRMDKLNLVLAARDEFVRQDLEAEAADKEKGGSFEVV